MEVDRASCRIGTGANERDKAYNYVRHSSNTEKAKADEVAKETVKVDNLVTQVAALTCAVAEKFQESDDKKEPR